MTELHVIDRGAGDPPLLLIAGIPAIADDWDALAEPLSATRRVIAYDNRGSGRSPVTPRPYTTRQLAADAVGVVDRLGIARAHVFGMSMGGIVAQEVAGWPDRVDRLVLGCTHAGVEHATPQPRETARAFAMRTGDWGERMSALAPHALARDVDPAFLRAFIAKKSGDVQDDEGYRAQIAAVLAHDTDDRLPRTSAPTLVITGDDDRVIPGASSEVLAERIPNAPLEVIGGAGHLFFLKRPEATLRVLDEFLPA